MNRQRKVVITVTYNDLGMIIDTKAEELDSSAQPNLQPTCNQLATDCISRTAAIDAVLDAIYDDEYWKEQVERAISALPSAQPNYEPVKAEDFARTMSKNTLYNFVAWHQEALTLMKEQGFVICKKTM